VLRIRIGSHTRREHLPPCARLGQLPLEAPPLADDVVALMLVPESAPFADRPDSGADVVDCALVLAVPAGPTTPVAPVTPATLVTPTGLVAPVTPAVPAVPAVALPAPAILAAIPAVPCADCAD